jgi:hypothetical protein
MCLVAVVKGPCRQLRRSPTRPLRSRLGQRTSAPMFSAHIPARSSLLQARRTNAGELWTSGIRRRTLALALFVARHDASRSACPRHRPNRSPMTTRPRRRSSGTALANSCLELAARRHDSCRPASAPAAPRAGNAGRERWWFPAAYPVWRREVPTLTTIIRSLTIFRSGLLCVFEVVVARIRQ